ncbi:MAG: PIN domain-containing protein [bacterium]|nr:PIN domain-containing protein [bacterium]
MTSTIEPLHVIDTHALIWYLTGDKKLSQQARAVFSAAERGQTRLLIPAMVLAELHFANTKWKWFDDFHTVFRLLNTKPYFRFIPFLPVDVLDFALDAQVPEMHDRIIVGLARRLNAPLITHDAAIKTANIAKVVW